MAILNCATGRSVGHRHYLEIGSDGASTDIDELSHVIVGVKGPDTTLEVEMLVELNALGLPDVRIELVRPVITRSQGDGVIGYNVQEARLCERISQICMARKYLKYLWSQEIICFDLYQNG